MPLYRFGGTGEVLVTDQAVIDVIVDAGNWDDNGNYIPPSPPAGIVTGSTYYDYSLNLKYEWTGTELIRIKFNTEV